MCLRSMGTQTCFTFDLRFDVHFDFLSSHNIRTPWKYPINSMTLALMKLRNLICFYGINVNFFRLSSTYLHRIVSILLDLRERGRRKKRIFGSTNINNRNIYNRIRPSQPIYLRHIVCHFSWKRSYNLCVSLTFFSHQFSFSKQKKKRNERLSS